MEINLMSDKLEKFKEVLREVFQMDQAELDFGIYRIMNQKRDEIEKFLDNDLLPQVKQLLEQHRSDDSKTVKEELDRLLETLRNAGIDSNTSPKVRELQERYSAQTDTSALENEVFSYLANFFRRYYDNGDFISQRRYKKDVYAIPYEGEEVKLYWANYDQYYIKTTEYFKNYSFKLIDGKKINFVVVEATTEQNNNRAANAKERKFFLAEENSVSIDNGELSIRFHYDFKDAKQKELNEAAFEKVKAVVPTLRSETLNGSDFINLFDRRPTPKNANRTLLEKHINDYTARNTFDYFIHKDLGGFLRRELDFYIKNEVLYIDDINELDEKQFHKQVSAIKVIKQVGHKVIAFLEQLENFQKKLWLKKKFVLESNYCVTLDRVPRELWNDIIANTEQVAEWKKLFAIDEISGDLEREAYSDPLTERFLEQNQFLLIDTAFFGEEIKTKLLKSINKIDEQTNGLLIHSENFQALNFLFNRYSHQIDTTYIDPPYNTIHSEIVYKNNYKHSSWLSLMLNVIGIAPSLFSDRFSLGIAIDDFELANLNSFIGQHFPDFDKSIVVVNHHPQGAGGKLSRTHEYHLLVSSNNTSDYRGKPKEDYQEDRSFMRSGTAENNYRYGRWKSFYALIYDSIQQKIISAEEPIPLGQDYPTNLTDEGYQRIYPINSRGEERVWRSSYETGKKRAEDGELTISERGAVYQAIDHEGKYEVLFSNWTDTIFNAGIHGSNLLVDMGLGGIFDYPKSIFTVETALWAQTFGNTNALVLDFFAGSATTGHAVINMNRNDDGLRKYILVEVGHYFETMIKPRIKKAVYSKKWQDGKPVSRDGVSHCFKYLRLESYEDTLNNLEVSRSQSQQQTLDVNERFREGYLLSYMLDVETEGSSALLNIDKFEDPFNYYLNITRNSETKPTKVDLVETFNYLIGLVVETIDEFDGYKVVTGKNLAEEKILIIWRNLSEKNNEELNAFFSRIRVNIHDSEFDRIYVNGDNYLENMKLAEDKWKVVLLEEEFKKRMFESIE
jgi:adenine-specific DNA-methyltransferase